MVSLDTTFLVDLRKGVPAAMARAAAMEAAGEPKCVTSPAAVELLLGANRVSASQVERTRELLSSLILLDADLQACEEAGRLGAELLARGEPLSTPDLMIAAISRRHGQALLTRDQSFARVPGLRVETY